MECKDHYAALDSTRLADIMNRFATYPSARLLFIVCGSMQGSYRARPENINKETVEWLKDVHCLRVSPEGTDWAAKPLFSTEDKEANSPKTKAMILISLDKSGQVGVEAKARKGTAFAEAPRRQLPVAAAAQPAVEGGHVAIQRGGFRRQQGFGGGGWGAGRPTITCYSCGHQGHMKRDCPQWRSGQQQGGQRRGGGYGGRGGGKWARA